MARAYDLLPRDPNMENKVSILNYLLTMRDSIYSEIRLGPTESQSK